MSDAISPPRRRKKRCRRFALPPHCISVTGNILVAALKPPGKRSVNSIIGQHLCSTIIAAHRYVDAGLDAEILAPGEIYLRSEIHERFGGVFIFFIAESVLAL